MWWGERARQYKNSFTESDSPQLCGGELQLGGRSKSNKQVLHIENAYVVKDGIEIGSGNVNPFWLFGLLY